MSKPKRFVSCVFVNPAGVGKREICFDRKTKKVTSNRAEIVTKSGRVKTSYGRSTASRKLPPLKCKPFRVGEIISGSPSWDASAVARFRVTKLVGDRASIEHVSGYNPLRGRTTVANKKVSCNYGMTNVFLNPGGGRSSGLLLTNRGR